ncbi:MAG: hypothetical protein RI894_2330, partial [Bacteroidota bacterium]
SELNLTISKLTPPSKILAFNPELRHNDALLISALSQAEAYSYSDAEHEIAEFVKAWQEDINLQGIVSLKNVGRFVADVSGRLHFLPEGHNYNNDVFGMPTLTAVPVVNISYNPAENTGAKATLEKDVEDTRPSAPLRPLRRWNKGKMSWREVSVAAAALLIIFTIGWRLIASEKEPSAMIATAKRINGENGLKTPAKTSAKTATEATTEASVFPMSTAADNTGNTVENDSQNSAVNKEPMASKEKQAQKVSVVKAVSIVSTKAIVPTAKTNAAPEKNKKNEAVEVFTIALGSFKSPVNVEMLTAKAKERGDVVVTRLGGKGLTTVSMTVQLHRSELKEKLESVRNIYGQTAVVLKK